MMPLLALDKSLLADMIVPNLHLLESVIQQVTDQVLVLILQSGGVVVTAAAEIITIHFAGTALYIVHKLIGFDLAPTTKS
jgi:hypothetical protein